MRHGLTPSPSLSGGAPTQLSLRRRGVAQRLGDALPMLVAFTSGWLRHVDEEVRLTAPQVRTLGFLGANPGVSLTEVAAVLEVRKPTASILMRRLLEQGLVANAGNSGGRRRMTLHLTELGAERLARFQTALQAVIGVHMASLSPDDVTMLDQSVDALLRLAAPPPAE